MAIFYKLRYRKDKNNPEKTGYYAVVCNKGIISTDEVAEEIEQNCSMKRSDVLAVLAELREVIKNHVQDSHSVKLNGIGIFRPGIRSNVAKTTDAFTMGNVVGMRLNFLPEQIKVGGKRVKFALSNVKLVMEHRPVFKPTEKTDGTAGKQEPSNK